MIAQQSERSAKAQALFEANLERLDRSFDPQVNLNQMRPGGVHDHKQSLVYALGLLDRGAPADVERAEKIIAAALTTQNLVEGSYRYGNFKWLFEQETVTDINAVQFCLWYLIDILRRHDGSVSDDLRERMRAALAAGLVELDKLNVPWHYTNITLLQIGSLILGGEYLGESHAYYSEKGYALLARLVDVSNTNGAVFEYNSPGYCGIDIDALARIATHCRNPQAAVMATVHEERIWAHVAMRLHPATRKLAAPWSRGYYPQLCGMPSGVEALFFRVTDDASFMAPSPYYKERVDGAGFLRDLGYRYSCPEYLRQLILEKPLPYYVRELTNRGGGNDITTFVTHDYAIGTNAKTYHEDDRNQAGLWTPLCKSLLVHYRRGMDPRFGVLYALYLIDEKTPADHQYRSQRLTADRTQDEQGLVRSVQHRNKAIVLYHPPQIRDDVFSLKVEVTIFDRARIDEVRINEQVVSSLPRALAPADIVFVADTDTYFALQPLEPTKLGPDMPIELREDPEGNLALSIYNYRGPTRTFWEYKSRLPYFRANAKNGFVIEVGSARDDGSFEAFRRRIYATRVVDITDGADVREVTYQSGNDTISIKVDLKTDDLLERRINGQAYEAPFLDADTVRAGSSGRIELKGAALVTDERPAWLLVDEELVCYAAMTPSQHVGPLRLQTPAGTLESPAFGLGRIAYYPGNDTRVDILAAHEHGPVYFTRPSGQATVRLNGEDVSSALRPTRHNRTDVLCLPPRLL